MATSNTDTLPLDVLASHANSYASAHGLQVERRNEPLTYECAPISLLPNAYPRQAFERATTLAAPFNQLVDRISRDGSFLEDALGGSVAEADPFTGKLFELYKQIYIDDDKSSFAHSADRLGIHRSDYMLNFDKSENKYELKQVELNTIASSFAGLAVNVARLHRHLVSRFQPQVQDFLQANKQVVTGSSEMEDSDGVPENPALSYIPEAFNVAYNQYKQRFGAKDAVVLFVVQEGETNTVDQRMLEFALWDDYNIPVVRMSLTKAHSQLQVDKNTGALYIQSDNGDSSPPKEVAVVYFRAGYAPTDYPDGYDGVEWQARATMEASRATKSPCLGYHLAGTKKVQQELARPGTLERFFASDSEQPLVESLRSAFAGLYSLGDDATEEDRVAIKECLSGMQGRYVLKPQREGGGYNFYGDDLADKIRENVEETASALKLGKELAEFILMERLFPPNQRAILLRSGRVEGTGDSISELGCFGAIVASDDGEIVHNKYSGFLLRTKFSNVDEGGVASGFATLSSPFLC